MTDTLTMLWQSTAALYKRFGLDAGTTPPAQRRRYFREEAGELCDESCEVEFWDEMISGGATTQLCEEAADVIVTTLGLLQAHSVDLQDVLDAVNAVTARNDAKTDATHTLVNGKITRMKVLP